VLDWLTKPADWLLNAGGIVASWFVNQDTDAARFEGIQMMVATLVLAAINCLWQRSGRFCAVALEKSFRNKAAADFPK
jgi:hypothetical protein